jgi:hypothetical protein
MLSNDPPSLYDHSMAPAPAFTPHEQEHFSDPATTFAARHDLFPAEVCFVADTDSHPGATAADIMLPKCRVLIGVSEVYVFTDGPRGPVLAFYDELAEVSGDARTGFAITPANPGIHAVRSLTVAPTNRCGCGSRLRGFRPFGRISYVPAPAGV